MLRELRHLPQLGAPLSRCACESSLRQWPPLVYVAHPFAGDVEGNRRRIVAICRAMVAARVLPVAPQLYLPAFVDEGSERERALRFCCRLLEACDEVHVYAERGVSAGMAREVAHARACGIPVRFIGPVPHPAAAARPGAPDNHPQAQEDSSG